MFQICRESDCIWGSYGPKTTQKPSKLTFLAAQKTFEPWQLTNHKCYTNETYHDYVSSWDLSFGTILEPFPHGGKWVWSRNHSKRPQNSWTFNLDLTSKQFEKSYEGLGFFTVNLNHLTLDVTIVGYVIEFPPRSGGGGGDRLQKTTQKYPKIVLLAGRKAFEHW